jgi:hypothetical protein
VSLTFERSARVFVFQSGENGFFDVSPSDCVISDVSAAAAAPHTDLSSACRCKRGLGLPSAAEGQVLSVVASNIATASDYMYGFIEARRSFHRPKVFFYFCTA